MQNFRVELFRVKIFRGLKVPTKIFLLENFDTCTRWRTGAKEIVVFVDA